MGGKAELVKRGHGLDLKTAVDENTRVAGEGRRIARDRDDERQSRGGERARLLERAGARRVDERRVEGREFFGAQWTAEKVARLGFQLAQARRRRGATGDRGDRGGVGVGGENLVATGEPQRESAGAAEQVRDFFRIRKRSLGEVREPRFSRFGRLQKPPGGSLTSASPNATRGGRRSITTSP